MPTTSKKVTICDNCGIEIEIVAVKLPVPDLDIAGIWFGIEEKHLWCEGQTFCTIGCFFAYVEKFIEGRKE